MNSWAMLLLLQMAQGRYLRLGRPATLNEWWGLTAMAQEVNGWTVIVG